MPRREDLLHKFLVMLSHGCPLRLELILYSLPKWCGAFFPGSVDAPENEATNDDPRNGSGIDGGAVLGNEVLN